MLYLWVIAGFYLNITCTKRPTAIHPQRKPQTNACQGFMGCLFRGISDSFSLHNS